MTVKILQVHRLVCATVIAAASLLSGCTAAPELEHSQPLVIAAGQYASAFDAAVEAARAEGMPAALRDRRSGIIETEARPAGSLLEPWRTDNASTAQALENTVSYQRRRVRIEFQPLTNSESDPGREASSLNGDASLPETDLRGDLTKAHVPLEMHVWVVLERAYRPGVRRHTWSRQLTTVSPRDSRAARVEDEDRDVPDGLSSQFWVTIGRDVAFEQHLVATIRQRLAAR